MIKQLKIEGSRGFFRYLGKDEKGTQVKFRFGHDETMANLRAAKLLALWDRYQAHPGSPAYWTEPHLAIAKAIAKGETEVGVGPNPAMSGKDDYVYWVDRWASLYADLVRVVPEQSESYEAAAAEMVESRQQQIKRVKVGHPLPRMGKAAAGAGQTLHQGLDAYIAHLKAEAKNRAGYSAVKVRQAQTLREHAADVPLVRYGLAAMEEHLAYWSNRPKVKDRDRPISKPTARNQHRCLKDFWKWLHRNESFTWRRPEDWMDLRAKVVTLPSDYRLAKVMIPTFSPEEVGAIYKVATDRVRAFLLLGLNCGFSIAEISSLRRDEVFLDQTHPYAKRIGVQGPASWIRRVRVKSGVYGEWKLWPETVEALRQAMKESAKINPTTDYVFLTAGGNTYDSPTENGNKPSRIPNLWKSTFKAATKECPGLVFRSFKMLRKTSGDYIREVSSGEISGVFLCHGQPVKSDQLSDVYTNRPWSKVFAAIDRVRETTLAEALKG